MTPRRVGILGGMGPQATVLLMERLIAATPATDDADHIPLIVDQNPQVPSRIRHLIEGTGEDPAPTLVAMARRLADAGACALAMPCNTAHHYADAIRGATPLPFLDMVAASVDAARAMAAGGPVGILGSPALRRVGVFDRAFAGTGVTILWPEDEAAMLDAIRAIKTGALEAPRAALRDASAAMLDQGARVQMIACTEFSLIADSTVAGAATLDTLDVLVGLIKGFSLSQ